MRKLFASFALMVAMSTQAHPDVHTLTNPNIQPEDTLVSASGVKKQDLYNTSKGDGSMPPFRIPGITTAHNGRLITTAARLVCGTDPGYGQVDVVCRTSDDHGKTWSEMKEVAVGNGITSATQNYFETAFGDPAIVADRTSNEVLIMAVAGCTVYGNKHTTRQNPNMIATIRSTDLGDTWEKPVNVTEDIYGLFDAGNPMQSAFVGGGKIKFSFGRSIPTSRGCHKAGRVMQYRPYCRGAFCHLLTPGTAPRSHCLQVRIALGY